MKKRSHEEYVNLLKNKNPNIIVVDNYVDMKTKILHKSLLCGHVWKIAPENTLKDHSGLCYLCSKKEQGKKQNTHESYLSKLKDMGINYIPLEKYTGANKKIKHKCYICGYEWDVTPSNILSGEGCPECKKIAVKKMKLKTHNEYLEKLNEKNIQVSPLEEYKGTNVKILHACTCGNEWYITPTNVLRGSKCPKCKANSIREKSAISHEEFMERHKDQFNSTINIIGKYINSKTKIECECLVCGVKLYILPTSLASGSGCRLCANKANGDRSRKTHDQFIKELQEKNPDILILSNYKGAFEPIKCQCLICGYQWSPISNSLLRGSGCPKCAKNIPYTDEEFKNIVYEHNPNIIVYDKYHNTKSKINCICTKCGNKWNTSAGSLLSGTGCPKCAIERNASKCRYSHKEYIEKYSKFFNPQIKILGKYQSMNTPIECKCLECDRIFFTAPYRIAAGSGCDKCNRAKVGERYKKLPEEYIRQLNEINPNVIALSQYQGATNPISCKCKICGGEWTTVAGALVSTKHTGCPYCNQSHGEKEIEKVLKKYHITYEIQKEYQGLVGIGNGNLSYDFYLPDYNLLIEFQGEQHEHSVEGFTTEEDYIRQQEHDKRKRNYAISHDIDLLEIWYYEFDNIDNILKIYLNLESVETVMES